MKKLAFIIGGLLIGAIIFLSFKFHQFYKQIYTPKKNGSASKPAPEKTAFNILLLGYAGGQHEGTFLTDTIILLRFDTKAKKALLISIPRDVWVKIPTKSGDDFHAKINTVYQMGLFPQNYSDLSPRYIKNQPETALVSHVLTQITGLPIDHFVTIDFEGFTNAIDILGGVDIDVERSFDDSRYPITGKEKDLCDKEEQFKQIEPYLNDASANIDERDKLFKEKPELEEFYKNATGSPELAFPCRYESLHFDAGKQHMEGETSLKYVRSRNSSQDGGDFGRAKRQQILLEAVKEKVLSIGFIPKIVPLLDELDDHIETDIPLAQLQKFLGEAQDSNEYQLTRLVLTEDTYLKSAQSDDGQFILIPKAGEDKWDSVKNWIKKSSKQ